MRRVTWVLAIVMCVAWVAAGCGKKDAEQVVKDLDHVLGKLESYQGAGKMTLQTGQQAQEYSVEVWYQTPHYYRIALTNAAKDITQIVLRNDEGVFVLTPHLNKMFRFQSDWPENSGQVYLYQSLIQSIVMDNDRQFTEEKDAYVFDVVANYQNQLLSRQKIWLNKKDYSPRQVQVTDDNNNVMVSVNFTQFEFGKKFEKDSFDMQRNMTSWNLQTMPTSATVGDATGSTSADGSKQTGAAANAQQLGTTGQGQNSADDSFGVFEPSYVPDGVKAQAPQQVKIGEEKAVMFRYSGTYNYTLIESRPQAKTVTSLSGDILDLGYTLGVLTGTEGGMKTLTWTYDGVEFRLSTGDLPETEMIQIAQSVQGQVGK
jgi:outer membrane lipoprotein-sorting protein